MHVLLLSSKNASSDACIDILHQASAHCLVGEGQTEGTHSGKGKMSNGGGSFGVFSGLWTMACD